MDIKNFYFSDECKSEDLNNGVTRKILAYSDNIMMVEGSFEKDAIGEIHNHPHEQVTYILEGSFEFTIGSEKKIVKKGDTLYKQPNIMHGAVALEKSKLLDVFTPKRDDFVQS